MRSQALLTAALAVSLLTAGVAAAQGAPPPKPRQACAAEIAHFCPTAAAGRETMQCMRSHMAEASPGCQQSIQAAKATQQQNKAANAAAAGAPPPTPGAPPPQ